MKHIFVISTLFISSILFGQELTYEAHTLFSGSKTVQIQDIKNDSDGNTYLVGNYSGKGTIDFSLPNEVDPNSEVYNSFVAKLSPDGNVLWSYQVSSIAGNFVSALELNKSGDLYAIGSMDGEANFISTSGTDTTISPSSSRTGIIFKLSTSGSFEWVRQLESRNTMDSYFDGLAISKNGTPLIQVKVTGFGHIDFAPEDDKTVLHDDTFNNFHVIIALDANGRYDWHYSMDKPSGHVYSGGIAVDSSGNIFTAGSIYSEVILDNVTYTSAGSNDGYVQKLNCKGELLWFKHFGGSDSEINHEISLDEDGNVYLVGDYRGAGDFDPGEGEFILDHTNNSDTHILKLNNDGEFVWVKAVQGSGGFFAENMITDHNGDLYITGYMNSSMDFDPDNCTEILSTSGDSDFVIQKINKEGKLLWVKSFNGSGADVGTSMIITDQDELLISGYFKNQINLSLSQENPETVSSEGGWDAFLLKMNLNKELEEEHCPSVIGLYSGKQSKSIEVYPNPTRGLSEIYGIDTYDVVQVYAMNGQLLAEYTAGTIDFSSLSQGVYILQIFVSKETYIERVVKE